MNRLVTIPQPKSLTKEKELVLISRKEYENLLSLKSRVVPEIKISVSTRRAIRASEKELKQGRYLTLGQLEHELGS